MSFLSKLSLKILKTVHIYYIISYRFLFGISAKICERGKLVTTIKSVRTYISSDFKNAVYFQTNYKLKLRGSLM